MPITLSFNGQTYQITFGLSIDVTPLAPIPPAPQVLKITFTKGPGMAALLGLAHLSPAPAGVISRPTTIVVTSPDSTTTTVVLDMINPTLTFPCSDGDTVTATPMDVNIVGSSPLGSPVTVIAALTITEPPPAPSITGFSFAAAE